MSYVHHADIGKHRSATKPTSARPGSLAWRLEQEAGHPGRRPEWLWDLAGDVAESDEALPPSLLDPTFAEVVRFRRGYARQRSAADLAVLSQMHPNLIRAFAIYFRDGLPRWTLEARLLARQPSVEIAAVMKIAVRVVDTYEAVFFNVNDRLEDAGWILHKAIPEYDERLIERDVLTVLKLVGFYGGPRALDATLADALSKSGKLRRDPSGVLDVTVTVPRST